MNCIVLAKLVGILYLESYTQVDLFTLDCNSSYHSVIVQNNTFIEVDVININKDLAYNIKFKD